jgi:hypothetical protein
MAIKLSKDHIQTFIRAANDSSIGWPLHLAPEVLRNASALADEAYWKWVDAGDAADDAELNLPAVQAKWNKAAEDLVREDKDLPSTKELERAKIKVKVTIEDLSQAAMVLRTAETLLSKLLEDDSIRDAWRLAIEQEALSLQKELAKEVQKIDPSLTRLDVLLGLSRYLGDLGSFNYPPRVVNPDPREGLQALLKAKPWEPSGPAGNITQL